MMRLRRPGPFAVLLTVFGVAVFCALGVWQLERAAYKETVLTRFHNAATASLVSLSDARADREPDAYPHVKVTGRLQGGRVPAGRPDALGPAGSDGVRAVPA